MRLRVQLPTRWVRIDLAGDVDAQIDEFLAARLLTVPPRQRTALARTLEPLRQGYRSLGDTAALMVASPVYPVDGRSAHPQLVFLPFDPPEGQTPLDAVLAVASTDASAALLDLPDVVALRTSSSVPIPEQSVGSGTPGRDLDGRVPPLTTRRWRYLVGDPTRPHAWLLVMADVTLPTADDAGEIENLLDAIAGSACLADDDLDPTTPRHPPASTTPEESR